MTIRICLTTESTEDTKKSAQSSGENPCKSVKFVSKFLEVKAKCTKVHSFNYI